MRAITQLKYCINLPYTFVGIIFELLLHIFSRYTGIEERKYQDAHVIIRYLQEEIIILIAIMNIED